MQHSPILIIGKNAKTGLRVDRSLQALGYTTRAVSRSTSPAFDWEDTDTWPAALEGIESAYVTFYPDLAIPTAEQAIRDFVELAKISGLRHVVLLSGRGETGAERAEAVLEASGLDWNIVRANWFMQNFSESFMIEGILSGELMLPASDIVEPFVDVDDIADVVVAALTRPELRNHLFEVSGPRALTFGQRQDRRSNSHAKRCRHHAGVLFRAANFSKGSPAGGIRCFFQVLPNLDPGGVRSGVNIFPMFDFGPGYFKLQK